MEKLLDIMFHHGGTLKKNDDGKLVYSPDNRSCLGDLDEDTLDVFFVRNYFKELGYDKVVECWWLVPGRILEVGLRALNSDDELREMCFHAERNDGVVDVYFEHGVSTPDYEEEEVCHDDLQTNKETHVESSNQTPDDKSTTNPIPNLSTANTIPSTATPIPNIPAADPLTTNPTNEEPNPMDEPDNPKPTYRPHPKSSRQPKPAPIVKPDHKPTPKPKNPLKPNKTHSKPKSKFTSKPKPIFNPPKRITRSQAGRITNKGKQPLHVDLTVNESTSDDGSSEDTSYVPAQEASSSNDEELVARDPNPGSTVKIGVIPLPDGQVMFEKMYVCLSGCKNGFRSGCRPLIGLDGAFLKTQIGGQILSAVAQDANHHIYVIAWAIVSVKNKENWKWFLELLHDDLGDYKANGWCFISDMQKGLISAVEEVMPQVHHRFCVWHLWRNFNKQWKDLELRRLLWDAARSTTFQEFIDNMDKIKRVSEEAWTYLNKWPRHSWTKSQFSHQSKLDNICNNACEVFNARIKEARSKPIITLLEEVRMFVMRSIAKNKVKLNNHVGKLPPVIQSRLEKVRKESKKWVPIWTGDAEYEKFEVHGHPTNMVVDLGKRLCTCQFWMLTGIPCVHACAALARVNKRPEDFCHPLVTMDSYRKTYEHHINLLPGQSLWEKSVYSKPQAPNFKRKPGKLTTKRRKDADEGTSGNKKPKATVTLKRQLKPFTCIYCGIKGHTKRGCKKKRADALAAAAAAVAAAKSKTVPAGSTPAPEGMHTTNVAPQVDEAPPGVAVQNHAQVEVTDNLPPLAAATEIDLSQPNYGGTQDEAPPPPPPTTRPDKLPTKRRNSPSPVTAPVDPMQGATAATYSRLANFLKFVPTLGFKPPRKKNTE